MNKVEKVQMREELAKQLEYYVRLIFKEYGNIIPTSVLIRLKEVKDYKDLLEIEDINTISCFVRDDKIWFPEKVDKILKLLKFIPGNGISKNHKVCEDEDLVINDNTLVTYMKHLFLKGCFFFFIL